MIDKRLLLMAIEKKIRGFPRIFSIRGLSADFYPGAAALSDIRGSFRSPAKPVTITAQKAVNSNMTFLPYFLPAHPVLNASHIITKGMTIK